MMKTIAASIGATKTRLNGQPTTALKAAIAALLTAVAVQPVMADSHPLAVLDAVPGKFHLDARLRHESFDLEGVSPDRDGVSVRYRYGYTTPNISGFTGMVEGETLDAVFNNDDDIHPLDQAGEGTDLNQLWVQYANDAFGNVKVGRQVYTLDDHRFIGHVGWRQNIQSFDAVTAGLTAVENFDLKAFYFEAQNAVNGTYNKHDTYGINGTFSFADWLNFTGFAYQIEGDEKNGGNAAISNDTVGLRVTGGLDAGSVGLKYALSYANQEDNGGSPSSVNYDADYFAGDLSAGMAGATLGAGFEILEPQFRTPLATVHKFNGYADALLPLTGFQQGLEDYYVYAGYKVPVGKGLALKVVYHWFDAEDSAAGFDGGEELDLVASYQVNDYMGVLAKYGNYNSDGGVGPGGIQGALDKEMWTLELNVKY